MDGVINIYKPVNYTSHDCVAIVRRISKTKKVGHTGTLDPMAEGVLPICIGKATRIIEYFDADLKTYICTCRIGISTDTFDIWGNILIDETDFVRDKLKNGELDKCKIESKLAEFCGLQRQIPPKYSALKLNGKKLYEYAREGIDIDLSRKAREIYVSEINLLDFDEEKLEISFEVVCSKGTYVRSICADLGQALGTSAAMTFLKRSKSGEFSAEKAINIEELKALRDKENSDELLIKNLINMDKTLENLGKLELKEEKKKFFLDGALMYKSDMKIIAEPKYKSANSPYGIADYFRRAYKVYTKDEEFLGVAFYREDINCYKADKILAVDR